LELQINKNTTVKISKWNGKTKKEFLKLLKNNNLNENTIINTLLLPYIDKRDYYLNPDEIQYILINLRKISYNKPINYNIKCIECSEVINLENDVLDFCSYKMGNFPIIYKDSENEIYFNVIPNNFLEVSKQIEKLTNYDILPNTIEMLLHISKFNKKEVNTFEEIYEFYENLDIETLNDIEDFYNKNKSSLELKLDVKCPKCNSKHTYYFDSIPKFFDILMPKQILEEFGSF